VGTGREDARGGGHTLCGERDGNRTPEHGDWREMEDGVGAEGGVGR